MPPLWAFDPIWWRDDHHADFAANGVASAQALVKKDADNLQRLQLPASAIWLDRPWGSGGGGLGGWGNFDFDSGPTGFPDPEEMIRTWQPQHVSDRLDRQPRQQRDGYRSDLCSRRFQRRERVRREFHDHPGVGPAPARGVRALQEPAAGPFRRNAACAASRSIAESRAKCRWRCRTARDPDREGGLRLHVRCPGGEGFTSRGMSTTARENTSRSGTAIPVPASPACRTR